MLFLRFTCESPDIGIGFVSVGNSKITLYTPVSDLFGKQITNMTIDH